MSSLQTPMKVDRWVIVVLAGLTVLYTLTTATVESYGSDTSTYFELARSLRHQHRYWFNFAPHTMYPPGYPLLLAGLMTLAGETFGTLVKLVAPIYVAGLLGLYWFIRMIRGPRMALTLVVLAGTSRVAHFWSTVGLHSDVPFFTVSVYALLFIEIARRTPTRFVRIACASLAAICASYLILLRSVGITFVAGLLLWIVYPPAALSRTRPDSTLERIRSWLPVTVLPILVLLAWTVWTHQHASSAAGDYMQSYSQQLLKGDPHQIDSPNIALYQIPWRMVQMLTVRLTSTAVMLLNAPAFSLSWYHPLCLLVLALIVMGWLASLRRDGTLLDCYMLSYGALLLLYPFDEGTRYLFPVQPFLTLYAIDGLELLRALGKGRLGPTGERLFTGGLLVAFVVVVIAGVYGISVRARQNLHPNPSTFTNAATIEASQWVLQNTGERDVIMDDQHAILHRLTHRKTIRFPLSTDPGVIANGIEANGVSFVVVLKEKPFEYYNPSTMRRFEAVKTLYPASFAPVYAFDQGIIYRVTTEAGRP
jgi:hypothetical protein